MRIFVSLPTAAAVALALALVGASVQVSQAQSKGKSIQTEADWVSFDATAKTVTVKVLKPGRGKDAKMLKKGKQAVFQVKPEGSVLTRTTVKVNGRAGALTDIPEGKRVNIYWQVKDGEPYARSIDVVFSEEELNERYPDRDN
ncbi:MAG: hypothetical protein ABFS46_10925 [Myxococcota bacterium]